MLQTPSSNIFVQIQEIHVLRCSLLPDETLSFPADSELWNDIFDRLDVGEDVAVDDLSESLWPLRIAVGIQDAPMHVEIELSRSYPHDELPIVMIRGAAISREIHNEAKAMAEQQITQLKEAGEEMIVYQVLSAHLLPFARQQSDQARRDHISSVEHPRSQPSHAPVAFHALFTSHHLISTKKRRSLQQWSSSLHLMGFAKVGYPGLIYCEGLQDDVEEFVANVKSMQWLALHNRFMEALPPSDHLQSRREWLEMEKIAEAVQYMKALGRHSFVADMGIGSTSTTDS
ncbi:hypothetical protein SISSUDRAFT_1057371 [Sistotremastrum suecicum HHB10207 ss-3]|uniref:Small nuclear ribonucleoprotein Prp3 C-terminal domain-containing protein n=1 Tax=Sistotremastrum suecicum HHB10207 ss-3 TaxID=1314776 RepID=A0A166IKJ6_9AGAM|nr:hypothetical protein SISSUDRAFT_1057371 [Sistotremastrum suecicum HHB10207 ss-3]